MRRHGKFTTYHAPFVVEVHEEYHFATYGEHVEEFFIIL